MRKMAACVLLSLGTVATVTARASAEDRPQATHYSLRLQLLLKERRLQADVQITVLNSTASPQQEIPFLLYRLLDVASAEDEAGKPVEFTQEVVRNRDEPTLQVNYIRVRLPKALLPNHAAKLRMKYSGAVFGYPEVWPYVRDTLSEAYTLLRLDSLFYPVLARPSREGQSGVLERKFTYDMEVTVPLGHMVAAGGELKDSREEAGQTRFRYVSRLPTWRLDVAAAKFTVLRDDPNQLAAYVLPEHADGGRNVLEATKRALALYSRLLGPPKYRGFTAIEVPNGWGSQAAELYFLQTAAAFTDPGRIHEVYHEVAHAWSPRAKPEVQRCRFFDEAFASYFESLALGEFQGRKAFLDDMEQSRKSFLRWVEAGKQYADTPIVEYGGREMGGLSYNKGAWSLYVLHELLGQEKFVELMRRLTSDYSDRGADFKDFQALAEQVAGHSLEAYFHDWFYGADSSRLLIEAVDVQAIVARYSDHRPGP